MSKGDPIQLAAAEHIAAKWLKKWRVLEPAAEVHLCGSIRRKERMVRDIDILVIDAAMHGTFQRGAMFEGVELNLCFVKAECLGSGLLFLTGDHKFNITMRARAKKQGMKLNRYGLFRGDEVIASETESSIFKALDMDYIAPEQRKSPDGQKGITVFSSQVGTTYEVFVASIHGFDFCECRGFQFRRTCKHLGIAEGEKV